MKMKKILNLLTVSNKVIPCKTSSREVCCSGALFESTLFQIPKRTNFSINSC